MKSAPEKWVPPLEGDDAIKAIAAAEAIGRDLGSERIRQPLGLSLSRGQAGLALFFAYLERSLGQAKAGEAAQHYLDQAIAELERQAAPGAGLYHGFAGVAWVTEHLAAGDASLEDTDPNSEIDAALLSTLKRAPWQGEFDLLGGLVGWGVYALERLPRRSATAMLHLIVERLGECAEKSEHGVAWRDPRKPAQKPDVGMAHGAGGVIALLARILQEGGASPEVASLLTAATEGVCHSLFREEDDDDGDADLAWCAGHAGLSLALVAASRASGRDDWECAARRLATAAGKRFSDGVEGLDPALCHGTAGLSHLFQRLYQATGDLTLLAAARRGLERILARQRLGEGIGGYLSRGRLADGHFGWMSDPGFLGGAAGIGLALLAAATPGEPEWDRLLLLSGQTGRQR